MDFVFGGGGSGGGGNGGLSHENGPILFTDSNRTSATDDLRSVVLYVFIVSLFVSFFLILPGIRSEKFPTFLCITSSLLVSSIILVALFGTTWHVAEAPISAAYKAFSRDRIQGELAVRIGLLSVNITLKAHKYYILHETDGPIVMDNIGMGAQVAPGLQAQSGAAALFINQTSGAELPPTSSLADELVAEKTADGVAVNADLDNDEVFPASSSRRARATSVGGAAAAAAATTTRVKRQHQAAEGRQAARHSTPTIKRVNVDINYNERFYWIEPQQMRQEYQHALERGLPFPILTVVEYLSQDEAGFSWSRQYRSAGYYSSIVLWLSVCVCVLMFCLHCAAPKYGIYTMQLLGCLLLLTNFTYANLVPKGDQTLVIPFEGQSLSFKFGWSFWLVLVGGCISLIVGTLILLVDKMFPNANLLSTVLDVDFDLRHKRRHRNSALAAQKSRRRAKRNLRRSIAAGTDAAAEQPAPNGQVVLARPSRPPFLEKPQEEFASDETDFEDSCESYDEEDECDDNDSESESGQFERLGARPSQQQVRHRNNSNGFVLPKQSETNQNSDDSLKRSGRTAASCSVVEMEAAAAAAAEEDSRGAEGPQARDRRALAAKRDNSRL